MQHLTPEDLARREGLPVSTVYRGNSDGTGPRRPKIGKHVRYRPVDAQAGETQRLSSQAVNA